MGEARAGHGEGLRRFVVRKVSRKPTYWLFLALTTPPRIIASPGTSPPASTADRTKTFPSDGSEGNVPCAGLGRVPVFDGDARWPYAWVNSTGPWAVLQTVSVLPVVSTA